MSIGLFPATHDEDALVSSLSQAHPTLFYTVVEQSSVAISLTGPDARIVYANQAFCQLTGYRRDELLGQDHRILASQQTPRELYPQMWHNLAQGQPWSGQLINRKRDHSLYLAEVSISPIVDRHGRLEHYLAMHKDISDRYALEQRLRNNFSLITSVLNNIPVAVVVVDQHDQVLMDNLAYKTLCADCRGEELLQLLNYPADKTRLLRGEMTPVLIGSTRRWFALAGSELPGVNEEASDYFVATPSPRMLIVINDCSEQQRQQQQGRMDHLKQKLTNGKLLAAIRESVDAALIQLNCPINMLAAARRLNGEREENVALNAAWQEGVEAVARLQQCRPSLAFEAAGHWPLSAVFEDLQVLYHHRLAGCGSLHYELSDPDLSWCGQRTHLLAILSLWLDRALLLAGGLAPFLLNIHILARGEGDWLRLHIDDNLPLEAISYCQSDRVLAAPGNGMELRLIQTLVAYQQGSINMAYHPPYGTSLAISLPLSAGEL